MRAKKAAQATGWRGACSWLALVTALVLLAPAPTLALEDPKQSGWTRAESVGRQVFDVAVLRPLQVVQLLVSAAVFVPAYPVSLLFDGEEDVLEICITEPVDRAFRRPLGDL